MSLQNPQYLAVWRSEPYNPRVLIIQTTVKRRIWCCVRHCSKHFACITTYLNLKTILQGRSDYYSLFTDEKTEAQ